MLPTVIGPQRLHDAATTGNGNIYSPKGQSSNVSVALQGTGTTSGGAVTIEECYYDPEVTRGGYTGTWSTITTVNASDITGGKQVVVHVAASVWALRARISSDITGGGSISGWAWGN